MSAALEDVFRREAGRCTATLVRLLGDLDLAEEAVAEAFAIAARTWPESGLPPNPGGWVVTTARNRAIDRLRRESTRNERHLAARRLQMDDMDTERDLDLDRLDRLVDVVADDQLRLMFLCAHPALAIDAQVALVLRLLSGLTVNEIARAFLVPEATLALHFADLVALEPSREELLEAARWTTTHDPSAPFRSSLVQCLAHLGVEAPDGTF